MGRPSGGGMGCICCNSLKGKKRAGNSIIGPTTLSHTHTHLEYKLVCLSVPVCVGGLMCLHPFFCNKLVQKNIHSASRGHGHHWPCPNTFASTTPPRLDSSRVETYVCLCLCLSLCLCLCLTEEKQGLN